MEAQRGEIVGTDPLHEHLEAVPTMARRPVYLVLGNQDDYGSSLAPVRTWVRERT